jgi:hypothetical protein
MPLASAQLRDAINSANPARAALTAIVAFHGLRSGQLRKLQLTDIHDGRRHLDQRGMFGLSITGASRYSAVLAHPGLQNA